MEVKSTLSLVHLSLADLHARLCDLNNFRHALPPQVSHFRVEGDTCSFSLQGLADITLQLTLKAPEHIVYASLAEKPFPFHLHFYLEEEDPQTSRVTVEFNAELNPMMALMARGPLQNFVNLVAEKLAEIRN